MPNPADRKYSKEHEWVLMESDGSARIGITDFAQTELGDVVYVQLPRVGDTVTQFSQMGEVESVKAVSELFCPVRWTAFCNRFGGLPCGQRLVACRDVATGLSRRGWAQPQRGIEHGGVGRNRVL